MTTVTVNQTATASATSVPSAFGGLMARLSSVVEAAGMLSVAGIMALCINYML
ncbi:MAG: hypothetical protein PW843_12075 [Azospirillaceae bacterium]|nr:hypothetical protein [Azospirillaceae bacterium]